MRKARAGGVAGADDKCQGDYNGEQYFDGGEDYDEDIGDDGGDAYYD